MTKEEFLAELRKTHDHFDWILDPDTSFPNERRSTPRHHLRAVLKGSPEAVFDPLAALCYVRTGKVLEDKSWPDAARSLGLGSADAAMVLAATADRTWETVEGERRPVEPLVELRQSLVEATRARPVQTAVRRRKAHRAAAVTASAPAPARSWPTAHDAVPAPRFSLSKPKLSLPVKGILSPAFAVLRGLLAGVLALVVSSFLYVATVAYIFGLALWAGQQYDGIGGIDVANVLQRPTVLWIAALVIFAAAFHREYVRTSG
jgi:hypothetical protein